MKKKTYSAYHDFHTGIGWKLFLTIAVVLLIFSIEEFTLQILGLGENTTGSLFAFSVLCLGVAGLLFFFCRQFQKLSDIAKEIEEEEQ